MGMNAEIIAIGPFSKSISKHLDYAPERYKKTIDGSIITVHLFGFTQGSSLSTIFGNCLGITDPWDFNQHKVNSEKIDFEAINKLLMNYCGQDVNLFSDLESLKILNEKGFEFHFRPNG